MKSLSTIGVIVVTAVSCLGQVFYGSLVGLVEDPAYENPSELVIR